MSAKFIAAFAAIAALLAAGLWSAPPAADANDPKDPRAPTPTPTPACAQGTLELDKGCVSADGFILGIGGDLDAAVAGVKAHANVDSSTVKGHAHGPLVTGRFSKTYDSVNTLRTAISGLASAVPQVTTWTYDAIVWASGSSPPEFHVRTITPPASAQPANPPADAAPVNPPANTAPATPAASVAAPAAALASPEPLAASADAEAAIAAEPVTPTLPTTSAGDFALFAWDAGHDIAMLEAAARAAGVKSVWITNSRGRFVAYVLDAPAFVNSGFTATFGGGLLPLPIAMLLGY